MTRKGEAGPALRDLAPAGTEITDYDRLNAPIYLRLIDADQDGATWQEAASLILGVDPIAEPGRARVAHKSHLARARWMIDEGYRGLLKLPNP